MGQTCAACDNWFSDSHFSYNQWTKGEGVSRCKDCVNGHAPRVENPTPPLTYNGWEADVRRNEELHLNNSNLFDNRVVGMRLKQAVYVGDRSHPHLQALDNLKRAGLSYTGWEAAVRRAEDEKYAFNFAGHVERMRKKQALHVGDRSHPQLQALDSMKREGLTYVGWQGDVRKAENYHVTNNLVDKCLQEMRSKQTSYSSQQNARRLAAHASHRPLQSRDSDHNINEPVRKKARRSDDRQNKLAEIQENEECVVCWSSKRTHAFVPCGHMCPCNGCADTILRGNDKCPLCRKTSQQIIKIYH